MTLSKTVLHYHLIHGELIEKIVNTGLEFQVDIGSAQNINSVLNIYS